MEKTIELDCAPMSPRPDTYIEGVMAGSGVEYDKREPVSKCFGNWVWDFSDVPDEKWEAAQVTFKERITDLYESGRIRYGSW